MSRQLIRDGLELLASPSSRDKSLAHKSDERKPSKCLRRQTCRRRPTARGHFTGTSQTSDGFRRKQRKKSTIEKVKSEMCADHLEESVALLSKQKSSTKQLELIQKILDRNEPRWRKSTSQIHEKNKDTGHSETAADIDYDFEATM